MKAVDTGTRINLKSILFLTDFPQPSEAALPFAIAIAREFAATIHALHVLIPQPYLYMTPQTIPVAIEAQEENAQAEMQRVEARSLQACLMMSRWFVGLTFGQHSNTR
jgi:nucleotide-binding universal stress UspA family protein